MNLTALVVRASRGRCHARFALCLSLSCVVPLACGTARDAGPTAPSLPVFTTLEITPDTGTVEQGGWLPVRVTPRSESGALLITDDTLVFASDAPSVAKADHLPWTPVVTALAPGSASITARMTIRGVTKTAVFKVKVLEPIVHDTVVFTYRSSLPPWSVPGWDPQFAHVAAGGVVRWEGSPPGMRVLLLDPDPNSYSFIDTVDVSSGSGSRRFVTPGAVHFCSDCWDNPLDYARVYVH